MNTESIGIQEELAILIESQWNLNKGLRFRMHLVLRY